jgi:hypothetical protein
MSFLSTALIVKSTASQTFASLGRTTSKWSIVQAAKTLVNQSKYANELISNFFDIFIV